MALMSVSMPSIGERISEFFIWASSFWAAVRERLQVAIAFDLFRLRAAAAEAVHFALRFFVFDRRDIAQRRQLFEPPTLLFRDLERLGGGQFQSRARSVAACRSARACFN